MIVGSGHMAKDNQLVFPEFGEYGEGYGFYLVKENKLKGKLIKLVEIEDFKKWMSLIDVGSFGSVDSGIVEDFISDTNSFTEWNHMLARLNWLGCKEAQYCFGLLMHQYYEEVA